MGEPLTELGFRDARRGMGEGGHADGGIDMPPLQLCGLGDADAAGRPAAHKGGTLFGVPHRLDYNHLVPVETIERDGVTMLRLPGA